VVEEGVVPPPPKDPHAGNCLYFDICGAEPDSL
jgi:CRISPR/Cas system-associated exonuclease Cas4 (RecB family)